MPQSTEDDRGDVVDDGVVNDTFLCRRGIPGGNGALIDSADDIARRGLVRVLTGVVAHEAEGRIGEWVSLEFGRKRLGFYQVGSLGLVNQVTQHVLDERNNVCRRGKGFELDEVL